jgi:glycosyltransferase involved in cell wall biosynthesis
MASAIAPLHRLWRTLPQGPRRALLANGATWLAPRPDSPAPAVRLGVAVAGELDRASGLGEGARMCLAGLRALGVPCWEAGGDRALPPAGVPLVLHLNPAGVPLAMLRLGRALVRGRRVIGLWPWELPVVPASWLTGFDFVHEVWAPSRFSADAIRRAMPEGFGHRAVAVVPHPVASLPPRPAALDRAALRLPSDAVITLVVFNLASSFERKNPLAAIGAHRLAFGGRMDRVLVMRVANTEHFPDEFERLRTAAADLPNVQFDTRTLTRDEAHAVMAASDIVLSLHRSEGFGLVPAEAMLLGRAVVATDWSGTVDFLDETCGIPVPARLVPAVDPRGVFEAPGAVWAEPDVGAAAAALRALADDPALRGRLGDAARRAAATRLGPAPLADAVRGLGLAVP